MVWKQEEVCNRGIYPGREATSFYCRTSGIALSMREEEFFSFIATFLSHTPRGEWIQTRLGFLFPSHMTKNDYP